MGQSVDRTRFEHRDYTRFKRRLGIETALLHDLVERDELSRHEPMAGLELEAWLIGVDGRAAPRNAEFIDRVGSDDVVTELGRFNVEINVPPQPVCGDGLGRLGVDLEVHWRRCREVAESMGLQVVAIGILPTLADAELNLDNISDRIRYRALNQQVRRQRRGRPNRLDIDGLHGEHLHSEHDDVMLEAAATSFQVHLQLPADDMVRAYNASLIASAPMLALSANSPLLFGRQLWQETRVPLFEQSLNIGTREDGSRSALGRVGFGSGYAGYSLLECFRENFERFEPLLPVQLDEPTERLPHLRLHNGTIWRWTRPIVGFDADGHIHLRIEMRSMPAGPTVADMMANLAFSIGLVTSLSREPTPPEHRLPFDAARRNFYEAARLGLDAPLRWTDGNTYRAGELLGLLIERSREGLDALGVEAPLADSWTTLLRERVASGRNGALWQIARLDTLDGNLGALTLEYTRRQVEGRPVHYWY